MAGKSKDQKRIEELEAKCKHWHSTAQNCGEQYRKLEAENAELRRQLERTSIYASAFSAGKYAEADVTDEAMARIQRERDEARAGWIWYQRRFNQLVTMFRPVLEHLLPEWFDMRLPDGRIVSVAEEKQKYQAGEPAFEGVEQEKGVPTQNPILRTAAVIVGIDNGTQEIEAVHFNKGFFPGTVEELKRASDRYFIAVGNKAPTKVTGSFMDIYRISEDRLLSAIQQLVVTYFDPIASKYFGDALDDVYETHIKPNLDEYADPDAARAAYRLAVRRTLDQFAKDNDFEHPEIKLKPGPKKAKNKGEVNS